MNEVFDIFMCDHSWRAHSEQTLLVVVSSLHRLCRLVVNSSISIVVANDHRAEDFWIDRIVQTCTIFTNLVEAIVKEHLLRFMQESVISKLWAHEVK